MKKVLFNRKDHKGESANKAMEVMHVLQTAYSDVFYTLHKWCLDLNGSGVLPNDTLTDCCYQPITPAPFVSALMAAINRIAENDGSGYTIKFIDLGCGVGNNLFLANAIIKRYSGSYRHEVVGVELDPRIVRTMQGIVNMSYGDMLDAPLGQFNIIHFFNSLGRAVGKQDKLYHRFNAELKTGSIIILSGSAVPDLRYFTRLVAHDSCYVYERNNAAFMPEAKKSKSLSEMELKHGIG